MRFCLLLLVLTTLAGCSHVRPSAAASPSPLPSAAQPAVIGKGDVAYARRGIEMITAALSDLEPERALTHMPGPRIGTDTQISVTCIAAPGLIPVLLCHFGPAQDQPIAQAIFWYNRDTWWSQLYPQAPPELAAERLESLADRDCQIGCQGAVLQARQSAGETGPELLVVVNLSAASGVPAEEAQLLRLVDDQWAVGWVPGAGDWNYGHAKVTLPESGTARFRVRSSSWSRADSLSGYVAEPETGEHRWFSDRWERSGEHYLLRDHAEEPAPYGTLLRAIHYFSTGADEKARALLTDALPAEEARKALTQKPKRQGWRVAQSGEGGFLLDTQGDGKPDRSVRLELVQGRWLVAEVRTLQGEVAP